MTYYLINLFLIKGTYNVVKILKNHNREDKIGNDNYFVLYIVILHPSLFFCTFNVYIQNQMQIIIKNILILCDLVYAIFKSLYVMMRSKNIDISDDVFQPDEWFDIIQNIVPDIDEEVSPTFINTDSEYNDDSKKISGEYHVAGLYTGNNPGITHVLDAYPAAVQFKFHNNKLRIKSKRIETNIGREEKYGELKEVKTKGIFIMKTKNNIFDMHQIRESAHQAILFGNKIIFAGNDKYFVFNEDMTVDNNISFESLIKKRNNETYCSHPHIDNVTKTMIFFTFGVGIIASYINIFEVNENFKLVKKKTVSVWGTAVLHGFFATPKSYILLRLHGNLDFFGFVFGQHGLLRNFTSSANDASQILVIDRIGDKPMLSCKSEIFDNLYHVVNAYENEDSMAIDIMPSSLNPGRISSEFEINRDYPLYVNYSGLFRHHIDKKNKKASFPIMINKDVQDFKCVNPRFINSDKYKYVYSTATNNGINSYIVHSDITDGSTHKYTFPPHHYPREPRFIPKKCVDVNNDEDNGWIVVPVHSVNGIVIYVFDATKMNRDNFKPYAVYDTHIKIPYLLHGDARA